LHGLPVVWPDNPPQNPVIDALVGFPVKIIYI
jgi:hypothetical protein